MTTICATPKFEMGHLVATPGALDKLTRSDIANALHRHLAGDWGDLDKEDLRANNRALKLGTRLLSQYLAHDGTKFWIITEADRSVTTILLPEEY